MSNTYINGKFIRTENIGNKLCCSIIDFIEALPNGLHAQSQVGVQAYTFTAIATNDENLTVIRAVIEPPNDPKMRTYDRKVRIERRNKNFGRFDPYYIKSYNRSRPGSKWKGVFRSGFDYMVDLDDLCEKARECGFTVEVGDGAGKITSQMMSDFDWTVSDSELAKINAMLDTYRISDMKSIRLFMATCGHESTLGADAIENLNKDGTTAGLYEPYERGAGYIQITWRSTHLKFLKSVTDSFTGIETAKYIAENYPWEAAGWFWSSTDAKSTSAGSLDDYVVKYGDSKGVFLLTQYWVNGWPSGLTNDTAIKIRDNQVSWNIINERLIVNGIDTCRSPINWNDRNKKYETASEAFR